MQIEPDDFGPIFVTPNQIESWLFRSRRVRSAAQPPALGATVVAERVVPSHVEGQEPGEAAIPASRDMASSTDARSSSATRRGPSATTTT